MHLVHSTWLVVGLSDGQAEVFDLSHGGECIFICAPTEGAAGIDGSGSGVSFLNRACHNIQHNKSPRPSQVLSKIKSQDKGKQSEAVSGAPQDAMKILSFKNGIVLCNINCSYCFGFISFPFSHSDMGLQHENTICSRGRKIDAS